MHICGTVRYKINNNNTNLPREKKNILNQKDKQVLNYHIKYKHAYRRIEKHIKNEWMCLLVQVVANILKLKPESF